jgi:polyisoprenoid-binding protein YceI
MNAKLMYALISASLLLVGVLTFNFSAEDYYQYEGETPGTLTAIGDAGSPNVFTFERWHFAEITMPDEDPTQLQAIVDIDLTSVVCDWKDLETSVKKKKDYFHNRKFPKATVTISGATLLEDGSYETLAILALKGVEKEVKLNFTITEEKPYQIEGNGELDRRAFRFTGDGPKDEIPIAFTATLPL